MITYGSEQCADPLVERETCLRHGLSTDWYGKPNSYACPTGSGSGVGWILLPRSSLIALGIIGTDGSAASGQSTPRDLIMRVDEKELSGAASGTYEVTHKSLHVVSAVNLTPGIRADENACYLVELADRRRIARLVPINTSYNVRKPPPDVADYYSATLNSAVAWTWTQLAQSLWETVGTGLLGAYPGLPFTPDGTPENFTFSGYALDALGWVLERIGCTLVLDTQADAFSIARLAATDAAAEAALSARDEYRIHDSESIRPNYGRVPQTLRVYFPKQEAAAPTTTGDSPWHTVDATDPSGTQTGVATGTYAVCFDDLPAVYDSGASLTNSSALTSRANARAADFFTRLRRDQLYRVYGLPLSDAGLRPGGTIRATRWSDTGGGLVTEVAWLPREADGRQGGEAGLTPHFGNEAHSDPTGGNSLSWWLGGEGSHLAYSHSHTYLLSFLYHYLSFLNYGDVTINYDGTTINWTDVEINVDNTVINVVDNDLVINIVDSTFIVNGPNFFIVNAPLEVCGWMFWCFCDYTSASATINDWALPATAPDGEKVVFRFDPTGAGTTLTGMEFANASQVILLVNVNTSGDLTLTHEGAGSTAANRFKLEDDQDVTIGPNGMRLCWYDFTSARWRVHGPPEFLLTVGEVDGSPEYVPIHTILFDSGDGFAVSNPSPGVARIDFSSGGSAPGTSNDLDYLGGPFNLTDTYQDVLSVNLAAAGTYHVIATGAADLIGGMGIPVNLLVQLYNSTAVAGTEHLQLASGGDTDPKLGAVTTHSIITVVGATTVEFQARMDVGGGAGNINSASLTAHRIA